MRPQQEGVDEITKQIQKVKNRFAKILTGPGKLLGFWRKLP